MTPDELIERFIEAYDCLDPNNETSTDLLASYLYVPDPRIAGYLKELKEYTELKKPTDAQRRQAGNLLEQITVLAFLGLRGLSMIKSFRSAGPQYDLLAGGDDPKWLFLCKLLFLNESKRDIVVEAKCTKEKVSDQQFARLCSIMEHNLFQTTELGIFFTLKGATGFPEREENTRQKQLKEAKLRQVLFHAKTGKVIVVLDIKDILKLDKPASFTKIIKSKIRELTHLSGLEPSEPCGDLEVDLPGHLQPFIDELIIK